MANDNETVAEIVSDMYAYDSGEISDIWVHLFADRIEAAAKREIADEKRISDAVIQSLRDKKLEMAGEIAVKDVELERLRTLVKEMADELSKFHAWEEARALVAKAREVIGGAE